MKIGLDDKKKGFLQIHPSDNVLVALEDLPRGKNIGWGGNLFPLPQEVPVKYKFTIRQLAKGDGIYMYGILVGRITADLPPGGLITRHNTLHATGKAIVTEYNFQWKAPEISRFRDRTFLGYHRADGKVGTANHWIVVPLVYCENRNIDILKDALLERLGYGSRHSWRNKAGALVDLYRKGMTAEEIRVAEFAPAADREPGERLFRNIDGIKFLTHHMGCCSPRSDSDTLCGLIAGYITHPNVAGATVLSLGCQNAQLSMLETEIKKRTPELGKPLILLEQQKEGTETQLLDKALRLTFAGLIDANQTERKPAPISKLCMGLECGGSDGFSGISANPAVGYASDLLVACGGSTILSEFPELCGVEQELSNRCVTSEAAEKFLYLMKTYNARAEKDGSGFYANPTEGNIRDGLITDAIKSAGAARKGGTAPVSDVLDYPEQFTRPGLNLLCTPGGDIESVTAEVGAGANLVLFTTGLGTPTGNAIAPTIKLSSNSALARKMPDIIDIDCGAIVEGGKTIEEMGEEILDFAIQVASGLVTPRAVVHGQDDFMPWKRGISL
jgi:altronate hydrolase